MHRPVEAKLYAPSHTWAMKLSQLDRQAGRLRIATVDLPDNGVPLPGRTGEQLGYIDDEAADKLGNVFMTRTGTTLTVVTDSARAKRGHGPISNQKTRREGGIRTRDLSVPNAAR